MKKHLKNRWSCEQISVVLALVNNGQKCISPEAIYQYIYRHRPGNESLMGYLRIRYKKRYKKRGSPQKRGSIPGRVGIEPLVERVFKYTCIVKVPSKKADIVEPAVEKALAHCGLPVKSLTVDNGREFTDHVAITTALKIPVYFARPYHSWERARAVSMRTPTRGRPCELIRQYIPKGQRISLVSEEFVSSIQNELNHRPRKILGFLSLFQGVDKQRIALKA